MKNFRICEKSYKSQISKTYAPPESSKKNAPKKQAPAQRYP